MKHNHKIGRLISAFAVAFILVATASASHAAMDVFLRLDGISGPAKGFHTIVECKGGLCDAGRLPVGTYAVQVVWTKGGVTATDDWSKIQQSAIASTSAPASYSVTMKTKPNASVAPPDHNTGALTGRRQHSPLTITKQVDASTPRLAPFVLVASDMDADGKIDVSMAVKTQGASTVPAPKN